MKPQRKLLSNQVNRMHSHEILNYHFLKKKSLEKNNSSFIINIPPIDAFNTLLYKNK